jgi:hypothetical protein
MLLPMGKSSIRLLLGEWEKSGRQFEGTNFPILFQSFPTQKLSNSSHS